MPVAAIMLGGQSGVALRQPQQVVALLSAAIGTWHKQYACQQVFPAAAAGLVDNQCIREVVHIVGRAEADGKSKVGL